MLMLKWFDSSTSEQFGRTLARFFIAKIPPDSQNKNTKKFAKKLEAVDQAYVMIEKFKQENKLNAYKKARLLSAFKVEMVGAGFPSELTEQVVRGLIAKL